MKSRERAERAGRAAGKSAASWYFDGNTSDAQYAAVLRGIDDGDPMVLDTFPYLDLSGQWADGPTDASVLDDIGYSDAEGMLERDLERCNEIIGWYRDAYDMSIQAEIERMTRYHAVVA